MSQWTQLASEQKIESTISALKANGIDALVAENGEEAKKKVLGLLPDGAEVMNMTSVTLDTTGISKEIQDSERFHSARKKLFSMDMKTQPAEIRRLSAAPEYAVGSAHAVTEDGKILIASASGSQLPAYAFGSGKVIFVAGIQKIVKNLEEGIKRIYEYVLPLEDKRARKAYGVGSGVNKLLIINKEAMPGRITMIFVKENLGF